MDAWGRELGADGKVHMLSDDNGDLTRALGLDADLSGVGLGMRSKRYSMLLDGGVVKECNVEDDVSAHTICSAVHLLTQL
jgi:peroxiredoxin